jgi:hypothetical protein
MTSTIYIALPDEAVAVWRPVLAEHLGGDRYRILEQPYDAANERWEFLPGEEVICEETRLYGGLVLVAHGRATPVA